MSRYTHNAEQKARKATALRESEIAAKKAKKGKAGVVAQMKQRGYEPGPNGSWRRLPSIPKKYLTKEV